MMRVVLDTSVFSAALLSPTGAAGVILLDCWLQQGAFALLVCSGIAAEYADVVARPKIASALDAGVRAALRATLDRIAITVPVEPPYELVCIDPDDDMFFACAKAGAAQYLVSHDRQPVLPIGSYAGASVVTPGTFLQVLRASASLGREQREPAEQ